jgi:hypothetical protein
MLSRLVITSWHILMPLPLAMLQPLMQKPAFGPSATTILSLSVPRELREITSAIGVETITDYHFVTTVTISIGPLVLAMGDNLFI